MTDKNTAKKTEQEKVMSSFSYNVAFNEKPTPQQIRNQGKQAFLDGKPDSVCPYPLEPSTGERGLWMQGYYGARTEKNVGHILNKKP
jgi:ribosome modulation factor